MLPERYWHRKHSVAPWGNCKLIGALDHLEVPIPMSMAAAPAPPDALAGPFGYTAMSDATCEHQMGLGAEPLTVRMRMHRRIWGWCLLLRRLGIVATGWRTTMAKRPSQARDSIQLTALKNAVVAPRHAPTQSTPCKDIDSVSGPRPTTIQALHSSLAHWLLLQLLHKWLFQGIRQAPHLDAGVAGEQRHEVAPDWLAAVQTGLCAHLQPERWWQRRIQTDSCSAMHCSSPRQHRPQVPCALRKHGPSCGADVLLHLPTREGSMPCFSMSACTALMASDTTSSQSSQKDSASCSSSNYLTALRAAAKAAQSPESKSTSVSCWWEELLSRRRQ